MGDFVWRAENRRHPVVNSCAGCRSGQDSRFLCIGIACRERSSPPHKRGGCGQKTALLKVGGSPETYPFRDTRRSPRPEAARPLRPDLRADRQPVGKGSDAYFEGLGATFQTDEHTVGTHAPPSIGGWQECGTATREFSPCPGLWDSVQGCDQSLDASGGGILLQTSGRLRLG